MEYGCDVMTIYRRNVHLCFLLRYCWQGKKLYIQNFKVSNSERRNRQF